MRLALVVLFLSLGAAAQDARTLQDEGRALLGENRFQPALDKLEAANRLSPSPDLLVAIAQCHRELAYARLREAARLLPSEPVMRSLAQSLDELDASRAGRSSRPEPREPPAAVTKLAPMGSLAGQAPVVNLASQAPRRPTFSRNAVLAVSGAGAVLLLATAGFTHLHAASLARRAEDVNFGLSGPDRAAAAEGARSWQAGSNMLLGAGLFLGAASAALLAWRF